MLLLVIIAGQQVYYGYFCNSSNIYWYCEI